MLDKSQSYVLLGSCFSQHIGEKMLSEGYNALCNPLGTLFNPDSIFTTVSTALSREDRNIPLFWDESMREWRCWIANTHFRSEDKAECHRLVSSAYDVLGEALRKADRLFLTLGTNVCYRLQETGLTVTNCQRQPDALFQEHRMSLPEVEEVLSRTVQLLHRECPRLHVTFTLSPYRYRKYGFHGSQLGKATLLLGIDAVEKSLPETVDYFPSYEMMMDELRDYKWYSEDTFHPSPEAVEYIWKRLKNQPLTPNPFPPRGARGVVTTDIEPLNDIEMDSNS